MESAAEGAKAGVYDGILGAYYSEDRDEYFEFSSSPVSYNDLLVVVPKDQPEQTLFELTGSRIGSLESSVQIDVLRRLGHFVVEHADHTNLIQMLADDSIDALVIGQPLLNSLLNTDPKLSELSRDDFRALNEPFRRFELFNPISKQRSDAAEISNKFNEALETMILEGTYDEILTRFGQASF